MNHYHVLMDGCHVVRLRGWCCRHETFGTIFAGSDAIQQEFSVTPIADKMREARLPWYGYVLHEKEGSVRKIGLELEVSGKRPRGRPKQRWSDTLHTDMKVTGVHARSGKVASQHQKSRSSDKLKKKKLYCAFVGTSLASYFVDVSSGLSGCPVQFQLVEVN
ncbi:unnamed protein product [Heligmosomoides polygyrus]|uniref:Pkinase_fungal domain-containing protein n=1 Tax=Heligmosomoides polygyrus TaxID=6339 RepID=A0A183G1W7_HELPZ|nr:unnamed protein product [Heligmosomoides polygyrus]